MRRLLAVTLLLTASIAHAEGARVALRSRTLAAPEASLFSDAALPAPGNGEPMLFITEQKVACYLSLWEAMFDLTREIREARLAAESRGEISSVPREEDVSSRFDALNLRISDECRLSQAEEAAVRLLAGRIGSSLLRQDEHGKAVEALVGAGDPQTLPALLVAHARTLASDAAWLEQAAARFGKQALSSVVRNGRGALQIARRDQEERAKLLEFLKTH